MIFWQTLENNAQSWNKLGFPLPPWAEREEQTEAGAQDGEERGPVSREDEAKAEASQQEACERRQTMAQGTATSAGGGPGSLFLRVKRLLRSDQHGRWAWSGGGGMDRGQARGCGRRRRKDVPGAVRGWSRSGGVRRRAGRKDSGRTGVRSGIRAAGRTQRAASSAVRSSGE